MRSILALAVKDLRILFRVRSGLFFTFVWPVIVAVLFGLVFSGQGQATSRALGLVIVDEDNTEQSKAFIAKLEASPDFVVDRALRGDAHEMVRRGQRSAFVVIKPGFGEASQRMFYGEPRQIEIGNDPSRQAEASMIEGLLTKHAMTDFQTLFSDPQASRKRVGSALKDLGGAGNASPVAPLKRFLGELDTFLGTPLPPAPGTPAEGWQPLVITKSAVARERRGPSNGFDIAFPQGIVWGIIGCVMTFAIGLVSERVHGTFVRLQIAPLSRAQILAGKAVACFASIALVQVMLFGIGVAAFDVRPSSIPLLILACTASAAGFVGFMMMIAGLGKTEQAVAGAGWAMLMPMAMFGGAMIPQFIMPSWMQMIGNVSPIKWAILGLEGAVWRDFTLGDMLLPCSILLAFGAACFVVGVRGMRDT